jgi:hypothetical protein
LVCGEPEFLGTQGHFVHHKSNGTVLGLHFEEYCCHKWEKSRREPMDNTFDAFLENKTKIGRAKEAREENETRSK